MIQVFGIPMGSDPVPFFANLFLSHKEADWVNTQRKFETINVRKINHSFRFMDDLLSQTSNVKTKWADEENQIFLNKNDQTAVRSF